MDPKTRSAGFVAVLLLVALGLLGCSHVSARAFTGPHGEAMVYVSCGSNPPACYDLARQMCGGDYDLVSDEAAGATSTSTSTQVENTTITQTRSVATREFFVKCSDPEAAKEAARRQAVLQQECSKDRDCPDGFRCQLGLTAEGGYCRPQS